MRKLAALAFAGIPLFAAPAAAITLSRGLPERLPTEARAALSVANDEQRHPIRCLSLGERWVDPASPCHLGKWDAPASVLLWGDSHAMVTATAMEAAADANGASFLFAANADCPIGLGFHIDPATSPGLTTQGHYRRCAEYNAKMLALAADPAIRTIVLSSRWTNWRLDQPANPAERTADIRLVSDTGAETGNRLIFEAGFLRLVDALRAEGKRVVVVGPLPEPSFNVPERAFLAALGLTSEPAPVTLDDFERRHAVILRMFREAGVDTIRPERALCGNGLCPVVRDGQPLFFDHNHLSVAAARMTAPLYAPLFADPDAGRGAPTPGPGASLP